MSATAALRPLWPLAALAGIAIFVLVLATMLLGAQIESECGSGSEGGFIEPSKAALADIPGNYLKIYISAAAEYELGPDGWSYLAGIGWRETDHGQYKAEGVTSGANFAGAAGPMGIGIGGAAGDTWATYGVDGDHDGKKDVYDPADAIPAAARIVKAAGAPGDWPAAIFSYNHAGWYVEEVTAKAASYRGAARAQGLPTGAAAVTAPSGLGTPSPPLNPMGPIIATPADHQARALGNWQSDNAIDIEVPKGTDVLAVEDGTIVALGGSPPSEGSGVIAGYDITLRGANNEYFYTHLLGRSVHLGEHVQAGQVIAASGYANGVEHLHIATEHGNPMKLWGAGATEGPAEAIGGCEAGAPVGPAELGKAVKVRTPREFGHLPQWAMAGDRPPAELDARIIPDALWLLRTYHLQVTAGREEGHLSHGDGTALDMVPEESLAGTQATWDDTTKRLAEDIGWIESCGASGVPPACPLKPWVRFVGYNGYPDHGDPAHVGENAHLHVSWLASGPPTAGLSPPHEWIYAFPVPEETTAPAVASEKPAAGEAAAKSKGGP